MRFTRSLVIDHLERQNSSNETVCTYIYCDYNQRKEQTVTNLLSSLLQQVLQHLAGDDALLSEMSSLYSVHRKYDTRPTLTQITDMLRKLSSKFRAFYVVVDALDECAESEEDALRFISAVCSLRPQIRLLCTSRFSTIFEDYFHESEKVEISARSGDIRKFLESQLQMQYRLSKHICADPSLKEVIVETIIVESQGM